MFAKNFLRITRLTAIALMISGVVRAVEAPPELEELAHDYRKQADRLDFVGIPKITHPDDLRRFKASHLVAARLAENAGMTEYFGSLTWASTSKQIEDMPEVKVYEVFLKRRFEMYQIENPTEFASLKKSAEGDAKITLIRRMDERPDFVDVYFHISWIEDGQPCTRNRVMELHRHKTTWFLQMPEFIFREIDEKILQLQKATRGEQDGADQPATTQESKPEGKEKPQSESMVRPR